MSLRIYVGNLPFTATQEDVERLFSQYGSIISCFLPTDRETGRPRGFGFVEMSDEDGQKAISALEGTDMGGRALRVSEAAPREDRRRGPGGPGGPGGGGGYRSGGGSGGGGGGGGYRSGGGGGGGYRDGPRGGPRR